VYRRHIAGMFVLYVVLIAVGVTVYAVVGLGHY
jgi:hypothetical protein